MFALDFYLIFNELANFLKEGGQSNAESSRQQGNNENLDIFLFIDECKVGSVFHILKSVWLLCLRNVLQITDF